MLSGAKNPSSHREIFRSTQHDSPHGAMKLAGVIGAQFIAPYTLAGFDSCLQRLVCQSSTLSFSANQPGSGMWSRCDRAITYGSYFCRNSRRRSSAVSSSCRGMPNAVNCACNLAKSADGSRSIDVFSGPQKLVPGLRRHARQWQMRTMPSSLVHRQCPLLTKRWHQE